MDSNHETMIEAVKNQDLDDLVCPEYMYDALFAIGLSKNLIPYCGALSSDFGPNFGVLLHKGLLNRLSFPVLEAMVSKLEPILANEVFVFLRARRAGRSRSQTPSEISAHIAPIVSFQRSWGGALRPRSPAKKAVVVSAWNVGNIGDDVVTVSAQHICRESGYDEVVLLGPNGNYDEIRSSDLVVIGGGGLIYDGDWENVSNYTAPAVLAKTLHIPTVVLGVGTQGINKNLSTEIYRGAFNDIALITVRDDSDVTVLRDQCDIRNVIKTSDLAFALPNDLWRGDQVHLENGESQKLAVISLSKLLDSTTGQDGYARALCINTAQYLKSQDYDVIFAQHSTDDDELYAAITSEVHCRRVCLANRGIQEAINLYRSADVVVTSRFHGVIFASLTATPVAVVCSRAGKTGRMIEHDLLSLRDATMFLSKNDAPIDAKELIASALTADDDEVKACRTAALKNIDYLKAAVSSGEAKGTSGEHSYLHASTGGISDESASRQSASELQADTMERDWFNTAQKCLTEIASRKNSLSKKGSSGKKFRLIDFDSSDLHFEEAVRSCFNDSAVLRNDDIRSVNIEQTSNSVNDVILVKIANITGDIYRTLTRGFKYSAILIKAWDPSVLSESEIRNISVEAALRNYSIFAIKNDEMFELPIYSFPEFTGSVLFLPSIDDSQKISPNVIIKCIVNVGLFIKSLVR